MLKEIFAIGNYTDLSLNKQRPFFGKVLTVLKTYGLIFLFLIAISPVLFLADYCVTQIFHHKSISHEGDETFKHLIKRLGYITTLVYICLIGPILEETIFRLPLSFKRVHIAISITVAALLFGSALPFAKSFLLHNGHVYALLVLIIIAVVISSACFILLPSDIILRPLYKKTVTIISICLFGLMHVFNYGTLQWQLLWIYPIYVLPQLGMGVGLTYIRFKNGFVWAIALHCLTNSVSMALSFTHQSPTNVPSPHILSKPAHPSASPIKPPKGN